MKFTGTDACVATEDLTVAVNASVTLERPLLVKGEPGTGKTELARQMAQALRLPIIKRHIRSATKAAQGLYEYDAVSRLRDSQLGDARVPDVTLPRLYGALLKNQRELQLFERLAFMARGQR